MILSLLNHCNKPELFLRSNRVGEGEGRLNCGVVTPGLKSTNDFLRGVTVTISFSTSESKSNFILSSVLIFSGPDSRFFGVLYLFII